MAAYLSNELGGSVGQTAAPAGYRPPATAYHARLKRMRASFTLAAQATTDTLVFGTLPPGATFAYGIINGPTFGATATLAIGTAASTGKYRTADVYTAAAPTLFGNVAATDDDPLTAAETVIGTIAAAALPGSGQLVVDIFYSMP